MSASLSPLMGNVSVHQLDGQQLNDLVMPQVHDMAGNLELLEHVRNRRFDRDEPPPYRSPTPEFGDGGGGGGDDSRPVLWPTWERGRIIAELDELVSKPLKDKELNETQRHFEFFHKPYSPGQLYDEEAERDYWTVLFKQRHQLSEGVRLHGQPGREQRAVLIRHRIKKRWERLGIWNPAWGIPGRGRGPQDNTTLWKWSWQGDTPSFGYGDWQRPALPDHPTTRVVGLRRGLRRGQRGPLMPRHNLGADASKSAAESFITSRPWYTLKLDEEEERTRLARIPHNKSMFYKPDHKEYVRQRWTQSGDIESRWKWRHESPSPVAPELEDMVLSPSEIDAIDAIPPQPRAPPRPMPFFENCPCPQLVKPASEDLPAQSPGAGPRRSARIAEMRRRAGVVCPPAAPSARPRKVPPPPATAARPLGAGIFGPTSRNPDPSPTAARPLGAGILGPAFRNPDPSPTAARISNAGIFGPPSSIFGPPSRNPDPPPTAARPLGAGIFGPPSRNPDPPPTAAPPTRPVKPRGVVKKRRRPRKKASATRRR